MRKLFIFATMFAIASLAFAGCDKEKPVKDTTTLELKPSDNVEFEFDGGSVTITVATNRSDWRVVSNSDWCKASKGEGEFTITAAANESEEETLEAVVTVTAGEDATAVEKTIKVTQKPAPIPVRQFGYANLYYYEALSTAEVGCYQLQLPFDIEQGVTQIMNIMFYDDIVAEMAEHNKFPKGTYTIVDESVKAKGNIDPGTGTPMTPMKGAYIMHIEHGMPAYALLMKSGTMTISGEGDNVYVDINFEAEDSETGEKLTFKANYKYEGSGAKPLFTFVPALPEVYTTVFTKVKSANIGSYGEDLSYADVSLTDDAGHKEMRLLLYLEKGATGLTDGMYVFALENTLDPMTIVPGMYSPQYGLENTYYKESDGQSISVALPAKEGFMSIYSGEGNYSINFEFKGVNERTLRNEATIRGTYYGPVTF